MNGATLTAYCSGCGTRFELTLRGPGVKVDQVVGLHLACPLCAWRIDLTLEAFTREGGQGATVSGQ